MIKKLVVGFFVLSNAYACDTPTKYCDPKSLSSNDIEIICNAIYKIEGGQKTKYPFGVISIPTNGDYNKAKQITKNSIKNNLKRWEASGKTNCYLTFFQQRWCPVGAKNDPKNLNKNWNKNIHSALK